MPFYHEKDEAKKQEIKEKLAKETLPEFAANFEKSLKGRSIHIATSVPLSFDAVSSSYPYLRTLISVLR